MAAYAEIETANTGAVDGVGAAPSPSPPTPDAAGPPVAGTSACTEEPEGVIVPIVPAIAPAIGAEAVRHYRRRRHRYCRRDRRYCRRDHRRRDHRRRSARPHKPDTPPRPTTASLSPRARARLTATYRY